MRALIVVLSGWVVLMNAALAAHAQESSLPKINSPEAATAAQRQAAEKLGQPAQWTNSIGMKFQLIPAGEFVMGSATAGTDARPHAVRVTQPFYIGTFEVTHGQWEAITKKKHSNFDDQPDCPINFTSWYHAMEFINLLNRAESKEYRLPTEAEWEYAARAGVTTDWPSGNTPEQLADHAWFDANGASQSHPVGGKQPNAFGVHDMLGNVWEWCEDFYADDYYTWSPADNPTGPTITLARYRVLRGGSFLYGPNFCSLAHRDYYQDSRSGRHIGFRIVLPLDAEKK